MQSGVQARPWAGDVEAGKALAFRPEGLAAGDGPTGLLAQEGGQCVGRQRQGAEINPEQERSLRLNQPHAIQIGKPIAHQVEIALNIVDHCLQPRPAAFIGRLHGNTGERVVLVDGQATVLGLKRFAPWSRPAQR